MHLLVQFLPRNIKLLDPDTFSKEAMSLLYLTVKDGRQTPFTEAQYNVVKHEHFILLKYEEMVH